MWSAGDDEINSVLRFVLVASTTMILGYVNWLGLEVVGNMSIVVALLSMSPFVVMVLIGFPQVDPSRWTQLPSSSIQQISNVPQVDDDGTNSNQQQSIFAVMTSGVILWRPFLNNLFWNLSSFDSTASFVEDVEHPGTILPRAMSLAVIFVTLGYLLPLMVVIGATDSSPDDWVDGYMATGASELGGVAGPWLGTWVVCAAGISNIALFQAELSSDAYQLMGMSDRGFVPKVFGIRSRYGTPTYGILLGVFVIIAMGSFNLDKLIEMLNFNYAISLLMEYGAFIKLRISKPDGESLFGLCACLVFFFGSMGITVQQ